MRSGEHLPLLFTVGLVLLFGGGMDLLLASTGRETYPVLALEPQDGIEAEYRGNLRYDPTLERVQAELPALRDRALARAQRMTGLPTSDPARYVVRLKDFVSRTVGATSQPVRTANGDRLLISVSSEQVRLGQMDLEGSLAHELTHGLMREHLGPRYRRLPAWVREGVAVWAAGQIPERTRIAFGLYWQEGLDLAAVLDEQPMLPSLGDDYLENALLFQGMQDELGAESVRAFLRALVEGAEVPAAFDQATDLTWLELEELRTRAARRLVKGFLPPDRLQAMLLSVP
jgi:hypothetical protein